MRNYSEDALVEQPATALFAKLGYETVNAFSERLGSKGTLGCETQHEVVLVPRLRGALRRLNSGLAREAIEMAIEELIRDRSLLSPAHANHEVYERLKHGVKVAFRGEEGEEIVETVRVIDWQSPANNDFLLVSQFKVAGEMHNRRADLVGFVNGLPLLFIELKTTHQRLENAFYGNLRDYKDTIPQLFWYNAFILLSNGHSSKIGSMTAGWEHFFEWKKISNEEEQGVISLDTLIRGTCEKGRFLDLIENFTLFSDAGGALIKLIARNHQFLGVNNAPAAVHSLRENQGRLGVFWHTQGSGKSYSMVFFSQKVLRKIPGNWTFLIVTDRQELDDQIYKTFQSAGAVTEQQVQAESGTHLQQLLREDHRNIFTLIHKFHTEQGKTYPQLPNRSYIIVMTDEAHRTQYDVLALNMRNALPNAAFIGFTGTPLMAGEEKTREVFGEYVSVYNFAQSVADGITVPLYYENRIPEVLLINTDFNQNIEQLIEEAELNESEEKRLEREFAREYHLITRDDRLEEIARDIVAHFMGRGQMGKAMVVSIDKATAVRMYDKVQKHWHTYLEALRKQLQGFATGELGRVAIQEKISYMESTDMAVVVSQSQNEIDDFRQKGLDILTHRKRMLQEDLETKFKDETDPLCIVFVCAMWITGFDVPSLSTLYLDKPMRNHTLMQTIARANRVFGDKVNGLIVDYVGVFRNLQRALAIYGSATGGDLKEGEVPVHEKIELVAALRKAIEETSAFCREQGIDPQAIQQAPIENFKRSSMIEFVVMARKIRLLVPNADIGEIMGDIERLLDLSVATKRYVIREASGTYDTAAHIDLSQIDFDALQAHFARSRKHTEVEKLRGAIKSKITRMVRLNKSRANYQEKFQRLIDDYNAGSKNVELLFKELVELAQELNEEEQRHVAEQLSEEELTMFDLLTSSQSELSEKEKDEVKKVVRTLLATLKREKLVLDWRKKQQARANVFITVRDMLNEKLPGVYTPEMSKQKCDEIYQHLFDAYYGQGQSLYDKAS